MSGYVVARLYIDDTIIPLKYRQSKDRVYGVRENGERVMRQPSNNPTLDMLINDDNTNLQWVSSNDFINGQLPPYSIIGVQMSDGRVLYVARVDDQCGYYDNQTGIASYETSSTAKQSSTFEVLVVTNIGTLSEIKLF